MSIYSNSFPVSLRSQAVLSDAYCRPCGEVKYTHTPEGVETECGSFCIFCEDGCNECGASLF